MEFINKVIAVQLMAPFVVVDRIQIRCIRYVEVYIMFDESAKTLSTDRVQNKVQNSLKYKIILQIWRKFMQGDAKPSENVNRQPQKVKVST